MTIDEYKSAVLEIDQEIREEIKHEAMNGSLDNEMVETIQMNAKEKYTALAHQYYSQK